MKCWPKCQAVTHVLLGPPFAPSRFLRAAILKAPISADHEMGGRGQGGIAQVLLTRKLDGTTCPTYDLRLLPIQR